MLLEVSTFQYRFTHGYCPVLPAYRKEAYGALPSVCPALHLHYNLRVKIIHNAINGSILSTVAINFYQARERFPSGDLNGGAGWVMEVAGWHSIDEIPATQSG